jgi:hypothetical protein
LFISPYFIMGQYFKAVNTDKKEYVCPWCIGGGAKLWEWAANAQGAIFTLLLRKSSGGGGGDYGSPPTEMLSLSDNPASLANAVREGVAREGQSIGLEPDSVVGRWAGDSVFLVGDYDESGLYNVPGYRNLSREIVEAWNAFIEISDLKLEWKPCRSCSKH